MGIVISGGVLRGGKEGGFAWGMLLGNIALMLCEGDCRMCEREEGELAYGICARACLVIFFCDL